MNWITVNGSKLPEQLRVLILEDMENFRVHLVNDLKTLGFRGTFTECPDLATALQRFDPKNYDVIFSDWNLPDGTGMDFLRRVRSSKASDHIPFLMVTTEDGVGFMLDAVRSGADQYIVKPWYPQDLAEKLSFAWDKRTKEPL